MAKICARTSYTHTLAPPSLKSWLCPWSHPIYPHTPPLRRGKGLVTLGCFLGLAGSACTCLTLVPLNKAQIRLVGQFSGQWHFYIPAISVSHNQAKAAFWLGHINSSVGCQMDQNKIFAQSHQSLSLLEPWRMGPGDKTRIRGRGISAQACVRFSMPCPLTWPRSPIDVSH